MAGIIVDRDSDKRIQMSNNRWARKFSMGATWITARIGIRFGIRDSGAGIGGNPNFAFGFCSGTTNIYGAATVDNFVGIQCYPDVVSWSRRTGTAPKMGYETNGGGGGVLLGVQLIAKTQAGENAINGGFNGGSGVGDRALLFSGPSTLRRELIIELTRPGTHWNIKCSYTCRAISGDIDALADISKATFLADMVAAWGAFNNNHSIGGDDLSDFIDESNGELNSMCFYTNVSTPQIEISDIAVSRLA